MDKLALNHIEKYYLEANIDYCHTDRSKLPSHPTTHEVIQHLISLETCSGTSYSAVIEDLKSIRISLYINRAESLNESSMSIHLNRIICGGQTDKLKYCKTLEIISSN